MTSTDHRVTLCGQDCSLCQGLLGSEERCGTVQLPCCQVSHGAFRWHLWISGMFHYSMTRTWLRAGHRFYKWFRLNEKDSPKAENIQTSKYKCKNIQGNELICRQLHTKFLEHL